MEMQKRTRTVVGFVCIYEGTILVIFLRIADPHLC